MTLPTEDGQGWTSVGCQEGIPQFCIDHAKHLQQLKQLLELQVRELEAKKEEAYQAILKIGLVDNNVVQHVE